MNCNRILNEVIEYIENNLTDKIDFNKIEKISGMPFVSFQKIFCFLTGFSLSEYIRKRRLSRALEDLIMTDDKIIDIAIKYGYESSTSFGRAFYNLFHITPKEAKHYSYHLTSFPKLNFDISQGNHFALEYRILELEEKVLYGISTEIIDLSNKQAIADLWNTKESKNIKTTLSNENYYGYTEYYVTKEHYQMKYFILSSQKQDCFIEKVIPKTKWIAFKVNSKNQKDILKIIDKIYNGWMDSSSFHTIEDHPDLEIYYKDYCEYCIAIL